MKARNRKQFPPNVARNRWRAHTQVTRRPIPNTEKVSIMRDINGGRAAAPRAQAAHSCAPPVVAPKRHSLCLFIRISTPVGNRRNGNVSRHSTAWTITHFPTLGKGRWFGGVAPSRDIVLKEQKGRLFGPSMVGSDLFGPIAYYRESSRRIGVIGRRMSNVVASAGVARVAQIAAPNSATHRLLDQGLPRRAGHGALLSSIWTAASKLESSRFPRQPRRCGRFQEVKTHRTRLPPRHMNANSKSISHGHRAGNRIGFDPNEGRLMIKFGIFG